MIAAVNGIVFVFSNYACRRLGLDEGFGFTIDRNTREIFPDVLEQNLAILRRARLTGFHVEFLETRLSTREQRCVHVYMVQSDPATYRPLEEVRTPGYQICTMANSGEYMWFEKVEANRSRYVLRTYRKVEYD